MTIKDIKNAKGLQLYGSCFIILGLIAVLSSALSFALGIVHTVVAALLWVVSLSFIDIFPAFFGLGNIGFLILGIFFAAANIAIGGVCLSNTLANKKRTLKTAMVLNVIAIVLLFTFSSTRLILLVIASIFLMFKTWQKMRSTHL